MSLDEVVQIWPAVIEKLRETSPALAATFDGARPVGIGEEGLEIGFPAELTFNKRKAEAKDKRAQMSEALVAVTGAPLQPVYVLLDGEQTPRRAGRRRRRSRGAGREAEERIQRGGGRLMAGVRKERD